MQREPPALSPISPQYESLGSPWLFTTIPRTQLVKCEVHRKRPCPEQRAHRLSSRLFSPASPDHHRHRHQRAALEGDAPSCSGSKTRGKLVSLNSFPVFSNCSTVQALKSPSALGRWSQEASLLKVLYFSYNGLILQERYLRARRDRRGAKTLKPFQ